MGRPEVQCGRRGNSICNGMLKTKRDSVWLRRVRESVMGQGKICGHDPEGEGLRGEAARAFITEKLGG